MFIEDTFEKSELRTRIFYFFVTILKMYPILGDFPLRLDRFEHVIKNADELLEVINMKK
jgi:hypothetical protein